MAEYYAVLSRAIAGLTAASPDTRRAVYDKARNALISQLRAIEPPLPTSEISRQRLELEEAIRRVEREIQSGTLPPLPPRPTTQVLSPPPRAAAPPPSEDDERAPAAPTRSADNGGRRTPQEIFRQAILDAEGRGWTPDGQRTGARASSPSDAPARASAPARSAAARSPVKRAPPPRDVADRDGLPELPPDMDDVDGFVPPTAPEAPPPRAYNGRGGEPRLAPDYGYDRGADEPQPPVDRARDMRRGPAPIDPEIDEVPPPLPPPSAKRGWGRRRAADDGYDAAEAMAPPAGPVEGRRRRSRLPLLLFVFLVLTGGVAFAAWTQLPAIKQLLATLDVPGKPSGGATLAVPDTTPTASTTPAPVSVQPVTPPPSQKNADRLLPPGASAPATGAAPATGTPAADKPAVRIVGDPPPVTTGPGAAGSTLAPPAPAPRPVTPTPGPQAALTPPPTTGGAAAPSTTVATATQRAILYEEPTDQSLAATSTIALAGNVTWTFTQGADGGQIVGTVVIPDRKLKMTISIKRNADKTLPASHMVVFTVDPLAADFPGKSIQTVASMVLKSAEDAHGDILIGAAATISTSPGNYWIALSSAQRDLTSNMMLLRDRGWIDLRLIYANNQRAILTLQKGSPGETAFTKALAAWQAG